MTGDCDVQGDFVSSRNYPNANENLESCSATMFRDAVGMSGNIFNLETCCDRLMIGGVGVESSNTIPGSLSAGDVFSWTSNFNVTREGRQLFFSETASIAGPGKPNTFAKFMLYYRLIIVSTQKLYCFFHAV